MSTATIYAVIDMESEGFVGKERESACAWCVALFGRERRGV
jgi:hypothetical protein